MSAIATESLQPEGFRLAQSGPLAGIVLTLAALALAIAACDSDLDLSRSPQVVFVTNEFEVGETYSYGAASLDGPARIISVEVVASKGLEVLGTGAFDPQEGCRPGSCPGLAAPRSPD